MTSMNIDELTYGQLRQIASMFQNGVPTAVADNTEHNAIPVIVCTDKRGVVFGFGYKIWHYL
jgi:hypothetical protein